MARRTFVLPFWDRDRKSATPPSASSIGGEHNAYWTGLDTKGSQYHTHTCSAYVVYGALLRRPPRAYDQLWPKQQLAKPLRLCKRRGKEVALHLNTTDKDAHDICTGPSASSRNSPRDPPPFLPQPSARSQPTSRPQHSSSSRRSHFCKSAAQSVTRTTLHTASASADTASFRG